jgi:hypothetical protein
MRILSLILIMACGPKDDSSGPGQDTAWAPDPAWENAEVPAPRVLMEGLDGPADLTVAGGMLWVAETGAGRIWMHDGHQGEIWMEGLEAPSRMAADPSGLVVMDADRVLLTDGVSTSILAEGLIAPAAIALGVQSIWWVDEGAGNDGVIWRAQRDGSEVTPIAEALESPRGLAVVGERAVVAETGNGRLIQVSPSGALVDLATIGGTVRDVAADCDGVVVATESSRWPYPGFVSTIVDGSEEHLSESPPQPDRVLLSGDRVLWSTKQSIHYVPREGGTLTTAALRTDVADLVVWGQTLIWTDPDRGEVLAVGL